MKKFVIFLVLILLTQNLAIASTFGTYKPEYEYGLFDGIKFNLLNKEKKDDKIIQIREDADKKIEKTEESKEIRDKKDDDEYQMYKFMLENTVPI
mgnify:CR=1 FL=1